MRSRVLISLLCGVWSGLGSIAGAVTISWDCNHEADMKEYRLEASNNSGESWGVVHVVPHPLACQSPLSFRETRRLDPGIKTYRAFAIDLSGNSSDPSQTASILIKPSPIGNPGGDAELPLPPSPYVPVVDPLPPPVVPPPVIPPPVTPPPPVVPPPMPPPVVTPSALTGLRVVDLGNTSGMLEFEAVAGSGADIRLSIAPIKWGQASSLTCTVDGDCPMANLLPGTVYQAQGVRYFGVMNQGATYGPLSPVIEFRTPPSGVPPPVVPPPVTPPPPAVVTLQQAIQSGLDACLTRKLAHTACMKTISDALKTVTP